MTRAVRRIRLRPLNAGRSCRSVVRGRSSSLEDGSLNRAFRAAITVAILLIPVFGSAQAPSDLSSDARLDTRVNIARTRIYLGELLETLSTQTRVPLRVDETRAPLSGMDLGCFLTDRPLRSTMVALTELLEFPEQRWTWRRDGERWTLSPSAPPTAAAAAGRRRILTRFTTDLLEVRRVAALGPDAREAAIAARPELFAADASRPILDVIPRIPDAAFAAALDGQRVQLDPASLGPRLRELPGFDVSRTATLQLHWRGDSNSPSLSIVSERGFGHNILGSPRWEESVLGAERKAWFRIESEEVLPIRSARTRPAANGLEIINLDSDGIRALAPAIARATRSDMLIDWLWSDSGVLDGTELVLSSDRRKTLLAIVSRSYNIEGRESGSIWLFRHPRVRVHPRDHLTPWPLIKRLRSATDVGESPTFDALELFDGLSKAQLKELIPEFPFCRSLDSGNWAPIYNFRKRLSATQRERLSSAAGLQIREAPLVARKVLAGTEDPGDFRGVRLLEELGPDAAVRLIRTENPAAPAELSPELRRQKSVEWSIRFQGEVKLTRRAALPPRVRLLPE